MTKIEKLQAEARAFFNDPRHFTPNPDLPPRVRQDAIEVLVKRYASPSFRKVGGASWRGFKSPVPEPWRARPVTCECRTGRLCRACKWHGFKEPAAARPNLKTRSA